MKKQETTTMNVHRIEIHNFMGIGAVAYDFSDAGGVIAGANRRGKTSVIKALRAALEGHGVAPDAIRKGASEAEILVDLGDISVRRVIGEKNNTLTVLRDGERQKAPKQLLQTLLGLAPLDPLDLLEEKDPAKRKAKVLAALPAIVTFDMIRTWIPDVTADNLAEILKIAPSVFTDPQSKGEIPEHGLDVIKTLREHFYEKRTGANRIVRERRDAMSEAELEMSRARAQMAKFSDVPCVLGAQAVEALQVAEDAVKALLQKKREASESATRNERAMKRAAELRAEASRVRADAPLGVRPDEFDAAETAVYDTASQERSAWARVVELREQLKAADAAHKAAEAANKAANEARGVLYERNDTAEKAMQRAADLEMQAKDIEDAAGVVAPPSEQQIADATAELNARQRVVDRAAVDEQFLAANAKLTLAQKAHVDADFEARKLDIAVKTLTQDAPGQLLARVGLEGVSVDGETILVNGVSLDRLCGAESLEFAVEIARLLNTKSKLLIVDGLERLDDETRDRFLRLATRDGYQLIGTRVSTGEPHLEPIDGGAS
jgi:hypothetical protein